MASSEFRLAILASGNSSTSEPMLRAPGLVSLVISNNPSSAILERARSRHISAISIARKDYRQFKTDGQPDPIASNQSFQDAILSTLQWEEITHVAQQGWMIMTGVDIINYYHGRITNSHPGPLDPGFLDLGGVGMHGLAIHECAVILRRQLGPMFLSGPSIHLVDSKYDHGALLAYTKVAVMPADNAESLSFRIKPIEAEQSLHFWRKVKRTGKIIPIERATRLFTTSQYPIVEEAKRSAITKYSD